MDDLHPVEPGQLAVMRIHAAIFGALLLAMAAGGGAVLQAAARVPFWWPVLAIAVLLIYPVLLAPGRSWRAWGWRDGDDELIVKRGVLTEVLTIVPYARVQHLDVAQGPIERSFAVCRLQLHTAGTAHSLVTLPGLTRETAERLRDDIRARIAAGE